METSPPFPAAISEAFSVRDQVVIVTGAAGLIGSGIAEVFLANASRVILTDRPGPKLETLTAELAARNLPATAHAADLLKPADLQTLVDHSLQKFGRVDALINCGAIPLSHALIEESDDRFDELFHTNLRSAWLLMKYLREPMTKQGGGSIVNIASVNGHNARFPCSLYAGTKSGLLAMTRELSIELAPHFIRVNSVSPGVISKPSSRIEWAQRELHEPYCAQFVEKFSAAADLGTSTVQPLPRSGRPIDIAMACLYLCSPAARFVTGADILVDGGFLNNFPPQQRFPQWEERRAFLRSLPSEAWKNKMPPWLAKETK